MEFGWPIPLPKSKDRGKVLVHHAAGTVTMKGSKNLFAKGYFIWYTVVALYQIRVGLSMVTLAAT
ncbi:MAG: hypothetical protein HY670_00025 [Chloroflexi bacterium]|nr:hypothetical protein [Chloroflexota bacterium]